MAVVDVMRLKNPQQNGDSGSELLLVYMKETRASQMHFSLVEWFPVEKEIGYSSIPIPLNYLVTRWVNSSEQNENSLREVSARWEIPVELLIALIFGHKDKEYAYPWYKYNLSLN